MFRIRGRGLQKKMGGDRDRIKEGIAGWGIDQ